MDVSSYEPVVWVERNGEECSTEFVQQCEERSENVCDDVTETICEVPPVTKSRYYNFVVTKLKIMRGDFVLRECTGHL